MNNKEYLIKNKTPLTSSMGIAGIFIVFEIVTMIAGINPFNEWDAVDFIFLPIAILIVIVDSIDLWKIKNQKLMVSIDDEGVRVISYMFANKYIPFSEISSVDLREKDIEYTRNGKLKTLSGPSQSDLIRIMKVISDKLEG